MSTVAPGTEAVEIAETGGPSKTAYGVWKDDWVDAQLMQTENPTTFVAPTVAELDAVVIGSIVKISNGCERFWAKVFAINGLNGRHNNPHDRTYFAIIDNYLVDCEHYDHDDAILFEGRNIYDIYEDNNDGDSTNHGANIKLVEPTDNHSGSDLANHGAHIGLAAATLGSEAGAAAAAAGSRAVTAALAPKGGAAKTTLTKEEQEAVNAYNCVLGDDDSEDSSEDGDTKVDGRCGIVCQHCYPMPM